MLRNITASIFKNYLYVAVRSPYPAAFALGQVEKLKFHRDPETVKYFSKGLFFVYFDHGVHTYMNGPAVVVGA